MADRQSMVYKKEEAGTAHARAVVWRHRVLQRQVPDPHRQADSSYTHATFLTRNVYDFRDPHAVKERDLREAMA